MEHDNDQFYVCLMSNSSMGVYPENVLSSFTNVLARSCKISEEWGVGLSEIHFNPIPGTHSNQVRVLNKREESSGDDDDGRMEKYDDDLIEVFTTSMSKKRKRREVIYDAQEIEIVVNKNYKIVLRKPDLEDICYQRHDMNCGKLLEILSTKFERISGHGTLEELKDTEHSAKEAMFKKIIRTDWSRQPEVTLKATKDDFIVHVYMGSSKSNNIVLKFGRYASIEDFVLNIVQQIPKQKRVRKDLILLFNIFLHQYKVIVYEETPDEKEIDSSNVKIHFDEYGTNANLDTRTFSGESIDLLTLVTKFREGLVFKDEVNMTDNDKKQIRLAIGQAVLDVLRGNNFDDPQITKTRSKFSVDLKVPYAKNKTDGSFETFTTIVEPKHYQRMYDFLTEIYNQIPPDKRNQKVFIDSLENVFLKTEGLTEKRETGYSDWYEIDQPLPPPLPSATETLETVAIESKNSTPKSALSVNRSDEQNNFLYVYCDLIKPRHISDRFARFLRVIPLSDGSHHIRFNHIEYCPLERVYFDSISIMLSDSYGQRVKFNASTTPTFVTLHFVKMK